MATILLVGFRFDQSAASPTLTLFVVDFSLLRTQSSVVSSRYEVPAELLGMENLDAITLR